MLMNIGYAESIKLYNYTCFVFHDVDLIPENDRIMYDCRDSPRHLSSAVDKFKYKWVIKQQHIKFSLRKSMQALLITKISPSLLLPSLLFYLFSLFFLGEMGVGDTKLTLWFFFWWHICGSELLMIIGFHLYIFTQNITLYRTKYVHLSKRGMNHLRKDKEI